MRTRVVLIIATILMLVISVAFVASNMGFKITIPLKAGWNNFVALPYYSSYTDANSVLADIGSTATLIKRWDNATGTFESWNGHRGTNFPITPGEAYVISVSSDTNWIVVGANNPSLALNLITGYNNFVSVPYNTTATDAGTLLAQIPNATLIKRWDNATGTYQSWNGHRGTNFPLIPYEGVVISVAPNNVSWTPAHN